MKRSAIGAAVIALAAFSGIAAYYGGWATVTVENLPDQLAVGQPYNLTFSIRQHGERLIPDLSPRVEGSSGKDELTARAVQTNRAGFYTATITPSKAGDWRFTIQSGFGKSHLKLLPIAALNNGDRKTVALTVPEHGQRLFVAKGCLACHEHARVEGAGTYDVGPDLSAVRFAPDYLAKFLADPSIKPATSELRMPNLQLKPAEIAALVAFINADPPTVRAAR